LKDLSRQLQGFDIAELREIPVLLEGSRLKQGATYAILRNGSLTIVTATGRDTVQPGMYAIPKSEVPYPFWNRLIDVPQPERKQ
jgi:hypothetical protein